jgi:hypothetical protein
MNDVNNYAKNLLRTRGRRCVATILTHLEDNVWKHVPEDVQRQARSRILATVGEFQDLAMDMVVADTGAINEFWVQELEKIHKEIRNVHASNPR